MEGRRRVAGPSSRPAVTTPDGELEGGGLSQIVPLPTPPDPPDPTADTVASGPLVPAMDLMKLFSPDAWEAFVLEWAHSLKSEYQLVEKCGGAGDMGRDVIATVSESEPDVWDNFQCKHYDHPLRPGDIWLELGKAVYYSHQGEFTFPRKYPRRPVRPVPMPRRPRTPDDSRPGWSTLSSKPLSNTPFGSFHSFIPGQSWFSGSRCSAQNCPPQCRHWYGMFTSSPQ